MLQSKCVQAQMENKRIYFHNTDDVTNLGDENHQTQRAPWAHLNSELQMFSFTGLFP